MTNNENITIVITFVKQKRNALLYYHHNNLKYLN